ncbi:hypothetical protein HKX48_007419 [Thoreauomyces humboldtii]|nr:hypothetical protein HKX48_007419 [Thoreauomyces humboldtii]
MEPVSLRATGASVTFAEPRYAHTAVSSVTAHRGLSAALAKSEVHASVESTLQTLRNAATTVVHNAGDIGRNAVTVLSAYMQQYPALQTAVLTGSVLSVVPISVFAIYVAMTTLGSIFTAVMGVFLVEGGLIMLGLTVLLPVECCILGVALAAGLARYSGVIGIKAAQDVAFRTTHLINEAQQKLGTEMRNVAIKRERRADSVPLTTDDPEFD